MSGVSKLAAERHQRQLEELLSQPGNGERNPQSAFGATFHAQFYMATEFLTRRIDRRCMRGLQEQESAMGFTQSGHIHLVRAKRMAHN